VYLLISPSIVDWNYTKAEVFVCFIHCYI
jgi:hypothetical protein